MNIEIATGRTSNRNVIIQEGKLRTYIAQARRQKVELYRSMYTYDDEILEHMKIRKTVRGYKGKFYLKTIIFDIDKSTNTDEFTLQRARDFMMQLEDDWKCSRESIRFWYSGTGYHLETPNFFKFEPSQFLPEEVKNTFKEYFPNCDTMPYMPTGLIRVGGTLNVKRNRYKTLLTADEFLSFTANEIIALSERGEMRKDETEFDQHLDWSEKIIKATVAREKVQAQEDPTAIVTCMQNLWNRGEQEGKRHIEILRLISAFRRQGIAKSACLLLIKSWAKSLEPYEVERCVNNGYDVGYRFPCHDFIMAEHCSNKCIFYKNKNFTVELTSSSTSEEKLIKHVRTNYGNKKFDLKEIFPTMDESFWTYPKEFILIIGDTGIGKSALAQNISVKLKKMKVLYINSELPDELLFRRDIQIEYAWSKEEVNRYYESSTEKISGPIDHIVRFSYSLDLDMLRKMIAEMQPDLVVLDTIDDLRMGKLPYGEYKTKDEAIAKEVKGIVQQMNTIVIAIHHIPKSAAVDQDGKPKRLGLHSGKGMSDYEQQADKVIAFEGKQDDTLRHLSSKKARDESPFDIQLYYDWKTFQLLHIK